MYVPYDTRTVHPLDRYEYAQAGGASELAPVAIRGRAPSNLLAVMSAAQLGDFTIEVSSWATDTELVIHRTDRLIKGCDPDCYQLLLSINGGVRIQQAGNQVSFAARDIALYDTSRSWHGAMHRTDQTPMQVITLTFPRALAPTPRASLAPLLGTAMPGDLPGRSLIAEFLIGLTDAPDMADMAGFAEHGDDYGLDDALRECVVGLIRQRLGQPNGITVRSRQLLYTAYIRSAIRRQLGNPALRPASIAQAANISPRYLHKLFQDNELTTMQLLKRLRLEECHRSLRDPALAKTPIKQIIAAHGYLRQDQFAHDFKQLFGMSATQLRRLASQQWPGHNG
jgi:AraC-like DNA-binding protein